MFHNAVGPGRIHGHGGLARRVKTLYEGVHYVVSRNAPVARGKSAPLFLKLKFVAKAPHDDTRMVAVALHPLYHILPPDGCPRPPAGPGNGVTPLVVQLVDHQNAFLVGQTQKRFAVGIVAGAYVVEAKLLQPVHHPRYACLIGSHSHCTVILVAGHPLQEYLLAVEL